MAKVKLTQRVDLSEFGSDWKDCFIEFYVPSYQEVRDDLMPFANKKGEEVLDFTIEFLKDHYVTSMIPTDEGKKELKKEELNQLPLNIYLKAVQVITAGASGTNPLTPTPPPL